MSYDIYNTLKCEMEYKIKGSLYHETQISMAYNTNRIEGTRLSKEQTRAIYETNTFLPENNKPIDTDDIVETKNHFRAFDFMLLNANENLNESIIKEYHRLIKQNTKQSNLSWFKVGDYKEHENIIGEIIETTKPENVSKEMNTLLKEYNDKTDINFEDIIDFHYKFERIHPFQDGNGRVGRLIMFKECLKNEIVPFIVDKDHELFYKRGLNEYKTDKVFLIDTCLDAQDKYKYLCDRLNIDYNK